MIANWKCADFLSPSTPNVYLAETVSGKYLIRTNGTSPKIKNAQPGTGAFDKEYFVATAAGR